ncbi:MAG: hypothetical protein KDA98_07765 [Acidimicrobiales bacterium]|nr:hypothetical protein [Acidimicrobiales bacterium]
MGRAISVIVGLGLCVWGLVVLSLPNDCGGQEMQEGDLCIYDDGDVTTIDENASKRQTAGMLRMGVGGAVLLGAMFSRRHRTWGRNRPSGRAPAPVPAPPMVSQTEVALRQHAQRQAAARPPMPPGAADAAAPLPPPPTPGPSTEGGSPTLHHDA